MMMFNCLVRELFLGGRRYEDEGRRSNDGDYQRRDRYNNNNTSRRDYDGGRGGRYNNNHYHDRGGKSLINLHGISH